MSLHILVKGKRTTQTVFEQAPKKTKKASTHSDSVFFLKICPSRPPDVTSRQFLCMITLGRLNTGNSVAHQAVM